MPDIVTGVGYLSDLPLYKTEKPYYVFWEVGDNGEKPLPATNIATETYEGITVADIRGRESSFRLETHGFEILQHSTKIPLPLDSAGAVEAYKAETEQVLKEKFDAEVVHCFETRVTLNDQETHDSRVRDFRDPLLAEPPAVATHVDATVNSGRNMIRNHLPAELHHLLGTNRRVRLVKQVARDHLYFSLIFPSLLLTWL
ncbi:hypothetical protein CIB48_g8125 [Xylaria polymorpha]|nr:hypothetical protein CIB48_g8125 [Xylaria polymorpha]